jgi:hypothetical protein
MKPPLPPFLHLTMIKKTQRIFVAMVWGTVLGLGIALVVLPGPAFLMMPAGLAILAVELAWARRWLRKARELVQNSSGPDGRGAGASARRPVLGKQKQRAGGIVGSVVFVVAVALLLLAGAALVAIPAVLGIMSLESERARRWLGNAGHFLLRLNPQPGKDPA